MEESSLKERPFDKEPSLDDFDGDELSLSYYSPRQMPGSFSSLNKRKGYLSIRGQEAPTSLNKVSLVAKKFKSVNFTVTTKMEFKPEVYQHSAGLIMFYDNMNFVYLRKYYSQTLGGAALSLIKLENGERSEYTDTRVSIPGDAPVWMRADVSGEKFSFSYSLDGKEYTKMGEDFDTTKLSDEYCKYGEFTGAFVGMLCVDRMFHRQQADFDFFCVEEKE